MNILNSLLGVLILLIIAYIFSNNRKAIRIRTVVGALIIQFIFGALVLYLPLGQKALLSVSEGVNTVISYGNEGLNFLFAGLVSDKMFEVFGGGGFVFALKVLPPVIFFASLISVLYYLGIMQWVIKIIGGGLQKALKTSKTESMSAAANIFVGQTEAPLIVKPFIKNMSESELFAIMSGGLASVAGAVMIGYAGMGVPLPYLIAASFMAAPGGLLFAKILYPETQEYKDNIDEGSKEEVAGNILEAAANGAASGLSLALNIGAMLLAFISLIALLNGILGGIGGYFGYGDLSLQLIFGYIFKPLAWAIGVPWNEAGVAGSMIGQKIAINEFVAYADFVKFLAPDTAQALSDKTIAIITFALCGFANFGSIAILIGGLGAMAPNRRSDVARLGLKAVLAGSLSNLMSASIAGLFIELSGKALF